MVCWKQNLSRRSPSFSSVTPSSAGAVFTKRVHCLPAFVVPAHCTCPAFPEGVEGGDDEVDGVADVLLGFLGVKGASTGFLDGGGGFADEILGCLLGVVGAGLLGEDEDGLNVGLVGVDEGLGGRVRLGSRAICMVSDC